MTSVFYNDILSATKRVMFEYFKIAVDVSSGRNGERARLAAHATGS